MTHKFHSLDELEAFWEPLFVPHGEAAAAWWDATRAADAAAGNAAGDAATAAEIEAQAKILEQIRQEPPR